MFVEQFFVKQLAHSSYLLGGTETCAIVDPRRDVQIYVDAAKYMGMQITHILVTHLHADFVGGHMDLARITGAPIYAPRAGNSQFEHVPVGEGDRFEIEDLAIEVRDTPGHTPEHISYVVTDTARGDQPVAVLCGDTLFVGDVGRPDLFPGIAQELASKLFDSLHDRLMTLPDFCEVLPAHGAGSLCGRAMGAKRTSTIGYERLYNTALQITDRDEFIASLTTNMPGAPDHFSRCSAINGAGPELVGNLPTLEPLEPKAFAALADRDGTIVLDTRAYESFGGQHTPGAWHIDFGGNFSTFAGWMLPPGQEILLVSDTPEQAAEAVMWLRRVGLDHVIGYLDGGMFGWAKAGLPTAHVCQMSTPEFHELATSDERVTVVDVRSPTEFDSFHIEGAVNIPAPDLRTRYEELDPNTPAICVCASGHRSSIAAAILKQHGFKRVLNAAGGMTAYTAMGYGPACKMCVGPHGPGFAGGERD